MDGKTVVINVANSGIGKKIAIDLVSLRAKVIMTCRNLEKAITQLLKKFAKRLQLIQLDLNDLGLGSKL